MAKAEFVMLAHKYEPEKHGIAGWFMSQKLDGIRALWDGAATIGMKAHQVPWANVEKDRKETICTGLWSRYGKIIYAPSWWTDSLPRGMVLDGELWAGTNSFQDVSSIIKQHVADQRWKRVQYMVFDNPSYESFLADRMINGTNYKKRITGGLAWLQGHMTIESRLYNSFEPTYQMLQRTLEGLPNCQLHKQEQLPFNTPLAEERIYNKLDVVTNEGGEGLMLRRPVSMWVSNRSHDLLKVKKLHDSEGVVIGFTWGRETELGSKLLGMMGSLRVRWIHNNRVVEFDLSGFTDEVRTMIGSGEPGSVADYLSYNPMFPRGTRVTFKYRELTDSGIPKEARYWRRVNNQ